MSAAATDSVFPFPIPPAPPSVRPRSAPFTIPPPSVREGRASLADVVSIRFSTWTLGIPYPLLFVAGAAFGVLFASLIVLCTHSTRTAKSTNDMFGPAPIVAPVATWTPNVITIRPAAPDPMFDTPATVEPASLSPARPAAPVAKKAVTRNTVRRRPAGKTASGDLLTAAL